jgi:hypothetical protein
MSTPFDAAVMQCLSHARLQPYLEASGGDVARSLALYRWNISVSAAFFEVLTVVEVVVRNAIHEQLSAWNEESGYHESWFANLHGYLLEKTVRVVAETEARIARERLVRSESTVLAALPFGFWRYLLSNRYRTTLWPFAMRAAFPGLGDRDGSTLCTAVRHLHVLRNRIAHHEPIIRRDLAADYAAAKFVLEAVSPEVAVWALRHARLPELLAQRP